MFDYERLLKNDEAGMHAAALWEGRQQWDKGSNTNTGTRNTNTNTRTRNTNTNTGKRNTNTSTGTRNTNTSTNIK